MRATTFFEAAASLPGDDSLFETDGFLESGGLEDLALRSTADVQAYEVRGESWIAVRGLWSARRKMIRKLSGATIIEDWDVDVQQRLSLLVRATNEGEVRAVEVVGLSPARANADKKSVTVQLGTAHETDTAFSATVGEPRVGGSAS